MKIIALLPIKNEAWILPTFLSSIKNIADEILVLDDNSKDESAKILEKAGVLIIKQGLVSEKIKNMSVLRQALLETGRKRGGTHFIWLDADEAFSANFLQNGRKIIEGLKPGEKLTMRWIALWKSPRQYFSGRGIWSEGYKDFIVHDLPEYCFPDRNLSEDRTEGPSRDNLTKLPPEEGVVLHFQFVFWRKLQIKQAWYRCQELIKNPKGSYSINCTYATTMDDSGAETSPVPQEWLDGIVLPQESGEEGAKLQLEEIFSLFNQYNVKFFEPLEIWHVPELKSEFIKKMGREPKPRHPSSRYWKTVHWLKYAPRKKISRLIPQKLKNYLKRGGK